MFLHRKVQTKSRLAKIYYRKHMTRDDILGAENKTNTEIEYENERGKKKIGQFQNRWGNSILSSLCFFWHYSLIRRRFMSSVLNVNMCRQHFTPNLNIVIVSLFLPHCSLFNLSLFRPRCVSLSLSVFRQHTYVVLQLTISQL